MLGLHSAGRNTVHDTTVPAAAVICNLQLSSMLIMLVLAYWSGQTDLALCSLYMAESECCTNPVYAAVIRTASKQLQLHDLNWKLVSQRLRSDGQSVGQVELAACARLYPSVAQTLCLQQ
jgi:hypothetical protein